MTPLEAPFFSDDRGPRRKTGRLPLIYVFERIVGKRRSVVHRRYDRTSDSFIDVDAASLSIEEDPE